MKVKVFTRTLHPRQVFRISRAQRRSVENVFVRIEKDGTVGWGEASPNEYYGECAAGVLEQLEKARRRLESISISSIADIEAESENLNLSHAARCAVDVAMWDYLGKKTKRSAPELIWNAGPAEVETFVTLGLSDETEFQEKLDECQHWPAFKIKSGSCIKLGRVRAVRRRCPQALIAIDANAAWNPRQLQEILVEAAELKVCFIEQPFSPRHNDALAKIKEQSPVPFFADESCVTEADVSRAASAFHGINIKLVKCGGITPALRMLSKARELGLKTMIGCMLESSCLIAAGYAVAQRTDYADLDGAHLIRDDPFRGLTVSNGCLRLQKTVAGLGITNCFQT